MKNIFVKAWLLAGLILSLGSLADAQVSIIATPPNPNVEQEVTFTYNGPPGGTVSWDFGDGTPIQSGNDLFTVKHTYLRTGTFTVKVTDRYGTFQKIITVTENRYVSHDPASPSPGQPVRFTGVNFLGTQALWNYGDGTSLQDSSSNSFHTYTNSGTFSVSARDLYGKSQFAFTDSVTVAPKSISYSPAAPRVGDNVTFTAQYFTPARWDFGDGTVVNTGNTTVAHVYNSQGSYQVKAYDYEGVKYNNPTATVSVTISPPPLQPSISYSPTQPRAKETVSFTANNFSSSTLIRWDFGDGQTENDNTPPGITHVYAQSGTFTVRAYDAGSAAETASVTITVLPPYVQPSISYSPSPPYAGDPVTFTASDFTSQSLIRWEFGDGKTANASPPNTTHIYELPGTYRVNAYDGGGTSVTASTTVTVNYKAQPRISYSPDRPSVGERVWFTANNFSSKTLIRWDFGDGQIENSINSPNLLHEYMRSGDFLVKAYDGGGTTVTASIQITVRDRAATFLSFTPPQPYVNDTVTIVANNFLSTTLIRWDFGDGTVENDPSPPAVTHVYSNPGVYQVRAFDNGGNTLTAAATITVLRRTQPTISVSPSPPYANETVAFRANDFSSKTLIRWDFGDGTVEDGTSPPAITHAFKNSGNFQVTAYDGGGAQATASIVVLVYPRPSIYFVPLQPRVGENVTFRAVNFVSPDIKWDFGDGITLARGKSVETHGYRAEGPYRVTAYDSRQGSDIPFSASLEIFPNEGPRAPFSISYIQLRFEDGTPYKTLPLSFPKAVAYADLKFEGTGILSAQWLVDGQTFKSVSKSLTFAGQATLDSGDVPGLPTLNPGIHEVTLRILQPEVDFEMPRIRYFVVAGESEPAPVRVEIAGTVDFEGRELPASPTTIEVPLNTYFFLSGTVRNESRDFLESALLRIYLDDELIDQKLLSTLRAGETRKFLTSLITASESRKKIYIALYDISPSPARLIAVREILLIPQKK